MKNLVARRHNEEGAILLLALGFLTFVGVVAAVLLNYTTTSIRTTVSVREIRNREYSADGVAEAAINKIRDPANAASANVNNCLAATVNGLPLRADCTEMGSSATDVVFKICPAAAAQPCPTDEVMLVARVKYNRSASPAAATISNWSVRR